MWGVREGWEGRRGVRDPPLGVLEGGGVKVRGEAGMQGYARPTLCPGEHTVGKEGRCGRIGASMGTIVRKQGAGK